jgi:hypothetical protein
MTITDYYTLFTLTLVTLAFLVVPPVVKFIRLIEESERETEAAKRRIAARQATQTNLPAVPYDWPDPQEQT